MVEEKKTDSSFIWHEPVLVDEVIHYLNPRPKKIYLDATFGSGGHSRAILEHEPNCKVIAMDWDVLSLNTYGELLKQEFGDSIRLLWGNFANIYRLLKKIGVEKVDGILADFGTSYMQIKGRAGFSFHFDTPLDMRMDPSHQKITAAHIINTASEKRLRDIFWEFGEEKKAKKIADLIVKSRQKKSIQTTRDLACIVEKAIPDYQGRKIHPATKIFQALRICVNNELGNISAFLSAALTVLNKGGRLVCISFHSLEDRLVKNFFRQYEREGKFDILTKKVIVPTSKEIIQNPSARSAKLRAALLKENNILI